MTTKRVTYEELKQLDEVVCVWRNIGSWWAGTFFPSCCENRWSVDMWSSKDNTLASVSDFIKADSCEEALLRANIAYNGAKIMMLHTPADGDWAPPQMQEWSDKVSGNTAYEVIL